MNTEIIEKLGDINKSIRAIDYASSMEVTVEFEEIAQGIIFRIQEATEATANSVENINDTLVDIKYSLADIADSLRNLSKLASANSN